MEPIVMTGGTSGLGKVAAKRIVEAPGTRLILGARRPDAPLDAESLPLDLERFDSVRSFAATVAARVRSGPGSSGDPERGIGALILNAGSSFADTRGRTPNGMERTFVVNHLSHYLLLRLLLPHLSPGGIVLLTASGTHDPEEGTLLPPPRHARAAWLAYPESDPHAPSGERAAAGYAYAASKLCSVLTARHLPRTREAQQLGLTVAAFDPGPTPGTGLARDRSLPVRLIWSLLGLGLHRLVPRMNSRSVAGKSLADLALGRVEPPPGRFYAAVREGRLIWKEPSELARRNEIAAELWKDSAALLGLSA